MKIFADNFIKLQTEMINICSEYAMKESEIVFIYCFCNKEMNFSNFFYKINGKMKRKHQIKEEIPSSDTKDEIQNDILRRLLRYIEQIEEICIEYSQPMPLEMKIIYNKASDSIETLCEYDFNSVFSDGEVKYAGELEMKWFEELKRENRDE